MQKFKAFKECISQKFRNNSRKDGPEFGFTRGNGTAIELNK